MDEDSGTRRRDREAEDDLPSPSEDTHDEARAGMAGATRETRAVSTQPQETPDDMVRTTRERIAATEERSMAPEYSGTNFGDGFRFGLGFTIAGCLIVLALIVVIVLLVLVLA